MNDYLKSRMEKILAGRPLEQKKRKPIPKVSEKRAQKLAAQKASGEDKEMELFFAQMRKIMTGKCLFCGGESMKKDDEKFKYSLAHLLPKAVFKSVATHPKNIIELCYYDNSCHTNFDNGRISWEFIRDSKEWEVIKEQLLEVLPLVDEGERKHKLYGRLIELVYNKKITPP